MQPMKISKCASLGWIVAYLVVLVVTALVVMFPESLRNQKLVFLGEANLRVDVFLSRDSSHERRSVTTASLACPDLEVDSLEQLPPWLKAGWGWCQRSAVNLPAQVNAAGQATLLFQVDPAPQQAGIGDRYHPAPGVAIRLGKGATSIKEPEILAPDHWRIVLP